MRVHMFESSNVLQAAWDEKSGVIVVTFKGGKTYAYGKFTEEALNEWTQAPSAGSWFHRNVRSRPDKYPPVDVEPVRAETRVELRIERENVPMPPPPWGGTPKSIELVGPPMTGRCSVCNGDLEALAASGETGHACWTASHTMQEVMVVLRDLMRYVDGVLVELNDGTLSWKPIAPIALRMSGIADAEMTRKLESVERGARTVVRSDDDAKRPWRGDDYRPWRTKGRR